jgi:hypothetical protein
MSVSVAAIQDHQFALNVLPSQDHDVVHKVQSDEDVDEADERRPPRREDSVAKRRLGTTPMCSAEDDSS